ncbi:hypothetical protein V8G54_003866 [Vigna mungo]|uniref:Ornithine aminotransferase n=1 Tax=Vigna mungo TaxID=3915 RepID=A0AAQ3SC52_VIGMU
MAATRQVQCLLRKICKGSRSFGVATEVNASSSSSQRIIDKEYEHSAHKYVSLSFRLSLNPTCCYDGGNLLFCAVILSGCYHPLPIVFSQAKGTSVWDPEGNKYLDFLAGYSAVNQGHCHPKILKALQEQAERLTVSSRAFYNDRFPLFAEYVTTIFGYDMVLPMNTGAEGVETAMKLARKWGYEKKRIPNDEAIIVSCCGCFNGRTLGVISMSCDNEATRGFGPLLPGHIKVDFGDAEALERIFKEKGECIAAFILEPIQGEAGIIIPPDGYLKAVRDLCSKYNILMIADEIQSGLGRTGKMLACEWEEVRPDVVVLGKALGGGVLPVSAVLADKDVMLCIQPGQHGRVAPPKLPLSAIVCCHPLSSAAVDHPFFYKNQRIWYISLCDVQAFQSPLSYSSTFLCPCFLLPPTATTSCPACRCHQLSLDVVGCCHF